MHHPTHISTTHRRSRRVAWLALGALVLTACSIADAAESTDAGQPAEQIDVPTSVDLVGWDDDDEHVIVTP